MQEDPGIIESAAPKELWAIMKDLSIHCLWLRNLLPHIKDRTQSENVWEQGAKENICT
jgi:hypothetical protein